MTNFKESAFQNIPAHINMKAKKLFGEQGAIRDGSIAYLEPGAAGPIPSHMHAHDHLLIVVHGAIRVEQDGNKTIIPANEAYLVKGNVPHTIYNEMDQITTMIAISILNNK